MATANLDHQHTQLRPNENGELVEIQIEPGEAAPFEPMPQHPWEATPE